MQKVGKYWSLPNLNVFAYPISVNLFMSFMTIESVDVFHICQLILVENLQNFMKQI